MKKIFKQKIKKSIALLTTISLLISFVIGPTAASALNNDTSLEYKQIFKEFILPYSYGKITNAHYAGTDRVIINIQDLHCHPEVQRNISNIIESFDKKFGINKIYLEGAYGKVSTKWINDKISNNKEILEKMLDSGRLTGAEYYSSLSGKTEIIEGLEEKEPYLDNIKRLGNILQEQENINLILESLDESVNVVKKKYYTKNQYKLEQLFNEYKAGKISSHKYYNLLSKHIDKLGIDLTRYNNTLIYLTLLDLQKKLNYKKINIELKNLISLLKQQLPYSIYNSLLENTLKFSELEKFYSYIIQLDKKYNFNLSSNYKELDKYFRYIELSKKINPIELVKEDEFLLQEINTRFSQTKVQRDVVFLVHFEKYIKDFLATKITLDDYQYYKDNIDKYITIYNKYVDNRVLSLLNDYIVQIDKFYKINMDRNTYFAKNMFNEKESLNKLKSEITTAKDDVNKIMDNIKGVKKIDVVVTGGFHSQTVTEIIKNQDVSYIVITPNVKGGIKLAEDTYYELAKEQSKISFQTIAPVIASLSPKIQSALLEKIGNVENTEEIISFDNTKRSEIISELAAAALLESDDLGPVKEKIEEITNAILNEGEDEYGGKVTYELISRIKNLQEVLQDKEKLTTVIALLQEGPVKQSVMFISYMFDKLYKQLFDSFVYKERLSQSEIKDSSEVEEFDDNDIDKESVSEDFNEYDYNDDLDLLFSNVDILRISREIIEVGKNNEDIKKFIRYLGKYDAADYELLSKILEELKSLSNDSKKIKEYCGIIYALTDKKSVNSKQRAATTKENIISFLEKSKSVQLQFCGLFSKLFVGHNNIRDNFFSALLDFVNKNEYTDRDFAFLLIVCRNSMLISELETKENIYEFLTLDIEKRRLLYDFYQAPKVNTDIYINQLTLNFMLSVLHKYNFTNEQFNYIMKLICSVNITKNTFEQKYVDNLKEKEINMFVLENFKYINFYSRYLLDLLFSDVYEEYTGSFISKTQKIIDLFDDLTEYRIDTLETENKCFALTVFLNDSFEKYCKTNNINDLVKQYQLAIRVSRKIYSILGDKIFATPIYKMNDMINETLEYYTKVDKVIASVSLFTNKTAIFSLHNNERNLDKKSFRFTPDGIKEILKRLEIEPEVFETIEISFMDKVLDFIKTINQNEIDKQVLMDFVNNLDGSVIIKKDILEYLTKKKDSTISKNTINRYINRLKISERLVEVNRYLKHIEHFNDYGQEKGVFIFDGHGKIVNGVMGISYSESGYITDKQITQALVNAHNNGVNLENITLIFSSCYSYEFADNIINNLIKEGITTFPQIITDAGKETVYAYTTNVKLEGEQSKVSNLFYSLMKFLDSKTFEQLQQMKGLLTFKDLADAPRYLSNNTIFVTNKQIEEMNHSLEKTIRDILEKDGDNNSENYFAAAQSPYAELMLPSTIEFLDDLGNNKIVKKIYKGKSGKAFKYTKLGVAIGTITELFSFWNFTFVEDHSFVEPSIKTRMTAVVWVIRALSIGIGLGTGIGLVAVLCNPLLFFLGIPALFLTEIISHYVWNIKNIPEILELAESINPIDVEQEVEKTGLSQDFIEMVKQNSADNGFISVYDAYEQGRLKNTERKPLVGREKIIKNNGYALGIATYYLGNGKVFEPVKAISDSTNGINLCTYVDGYYEFQQDGTRIRTNEQYLEKIFEDCEKNNKEIYFFLPPNIYSFNAQDMQKAQQDYMEEHPELQQSVSGLGTYQPGITRAEIEWLKTHPKCQQYMKHVHFVVGSYTFLDEKLDADIFKKYFNINSISKTFNSLMSKPRNYMKSGYNLLLQRSNIKIVSIDNNMIKLFNKVLRDFFIIFVSFILIFNPFKSFGEYFLSHSGVSFSHYSHIAVESYEESVEQYIEENLQESLALQEYKKNYGNLNLNLEQLQEYELMYEFVNSKEVEYTVSTTFDKIMNDLTFNQTDTIFFKILASQKINFMFNNSDYYASKYQMAVSINSYIHYICKIRGIDINQISDDDLETLINIVADVYLEYFYEVKDKVLLDKDTKTIIFCAHNFVTNFRGRPSVVTPFLFNDILDAIGNDEDNRLSIRVYSNDDNEAKEQKKLLLETISSLNASNANEKYYIAYIGHGETKELLANKNVRITSQEIAEALIQASNNGMNINNIVLDLGACYSSSTAVDIYYRLYLAGINVDNFIIYSASSSETVYTLADIKDEMMNTVAQVEEYKYIKRKNIQNGLTILDLYNIQFSKIGQNATIFVPLSSEMYADLDEKIQRVLYKYPSNPSEEIENLSILPPNVFTYSIFSKKQNKLLNEMSSIWEEIVFRSVPSIISAIYDEKNGLENLTMNQNLFIYAHAMSMWMRNEGKIQSKTSFEKLLEETKARMTIGTSVITEIYKQAIEMSKNATMTERRTKIIEATLNAIGLHEAYNRGLISQQELEQESYDKGVVDSVIESLGITEDIVWNLIEQSLNILGYTDTKVTKQLMDMKEAYDQVKPYTSYEKDKISLESKQILGKKKHSIKDIFKKEKIFRLISIFLTVFMLMGPFRNISSSAENVKVVNTQQVVEIAQVSNTQQEDEIHELEIPENATERTKIVLGFINTQIKFNTRDIKDIKAMLLYAENYMYLDLTVSELEGFVFFYNYCIQQDNMSMDKFNDTLNQLVKEERAKILFTILSNRSFSLVFEDETDKAKIEIALKASKHLSVFCEDYTTKKITDLTSEEIPKIIVKVSTGIREYIFNNSNLNLTLEEEKQFVLFYNFAIEREFVNGAYSTEDLLNQVTYGGTTKLLFRVLANPELNEKYTFDQSKERYQMALGICEYIYSFCKQMGNINIDDISNEDMSFIISIVLNNYFDEMQENGSKVLIDENTNVVGFAAHNFYLTNITIGKFLDLCGQNPDNRVFIEINELATDSIAKKQEFFDQIRSNIRKGQKTFILALAHGYKGGFATAGKDNEYHQLITSKEIVDILIEMHNEGYDLTKVSILLENCKGSFSAIQMYDMLKEAGIEDLPIIITEESVYTYYGYHSVMSNYMLYRAEDIAEIEEKGHGFTISDFDIAQNQVFSNPTIFIPISEERTESIKEQLEPVLSKYISDKEIESDKDYSDMISPLDIFTYSIFNEKQNKELSEKASIWEEIVFRAVPAIISSIYDKDKSNKLKYFNSMQYLFIYAHAISRWFANENNIRNKMSFNMLLKQIKQDMSKGTDILASIYKDVLSIWETSDQKKIKTAVIQATLKAIGLHEAYNKGVISREEFESGEYEDNIIRQMLINMGVTYEFVENLIDQSLFLLGYSSENVERKAFDMSLVYNALLNYNIIHEQVKNTIDNKKIALQQNNEVTINYDRNDYVTVLLIKKADGTQYSVKLALTKITDSDKIKQDYIRTGVLDRKMFVYLSSVNDDAFFKTTSKYTTLEYIERITGVKINVSENKIVAKSDDPTIQITFVKDRDIPQIVSSLPPQQIPEINQQEQSDVEDIAQSEVTETIYLDDSPKEILRKLKQAIESNSLIVIYPFSNTYNIDSLSDEQLYSLYFDIQNKFLDLQEMLNEYLPKIDDSRSMAYVLKEFIKNAFVHGNLSDPSQPIYIKFIENGFMVINEAETLEDEQIRLKRFNLSAAATLSGAHRGLQIVRDYEEAGLIKLEQEVKTKEAVTENDEKKKVSYYIVSAVRTSEDYQTQTKINFKSLIERVFGITDLIEKVNNKYPEDRSKSMTEAEQILTDMFTPEELEIIDLLASTIFDSIKYVNSTRNTSAVEFVNIIYSLQNGLFNDNLIMFEGDLKQHILDVLKHYIEISIQKKGAENILVKVVRDNKNILEDMATFLTDIIVKKNLTEKAKQQREQRKRNLGKFIEGVQRDDTEFSAIMICSANENRSAIWHIIFEDFLKRTKRKLTKVFSAGVFYDISQEIIRQTGKARVLRDDYHETLTFDERYKGIDENIKSGFRSTYIKYLKIPKGSQKVFIVAGEQHRAQLIKLGYDPDWIFLMSEFYSEEFKTAFKLAHESLGEELEENNIFSMSEYPDPFEEQILRQDLPELTKSLVEYVFKTKDDTIRETLPEKFVQFTDDYNQFEHMENLPSFAFTDSEKREATRELYEDEISKLVSEKYQFEFAANTKYLYILQNRKNKKALLNVISRSDAELKFKLFALMYLSVIGRQVTQEEQNVINSEKEKMLVELKNQLETNSFKILNNFDLRACMMGIYLMLKDYSARNTVHEIVYKAFIINKDGKVLANSDGYFAGIDLFTIIHELTHVLVGKPGFYNYLAAQTIDELVSYVMPNMFLSMAKLSLQAYSQLQSSYTIHQTDGIIDYVKMGKKTHVLYNLFSGRVEDRDLRQEEHTASIAFLDLLFNAHRRIGVNVYWPELMETISMIDDEEIDQSYMLWMIVNEYAERLVSKNKISKQEAKRLLKEMEKMQMWTLLSFDIVQNIKTTDLDTYNKILENKSAISFEERLLSEPAETKEQLKKISDVIKSKEQLSKNDVLTLLIIDVINSVDYEQLTNNFDGVIEGMLNAIKIAAQTFDMQRGTYLLSEYEQISKYVIDNYYITQNSTINVMDNIFEFISNNLDKLFFVKLLISKIFGVKNITKMLSDKKLLIVTSKQQEKILQQVLQNNGMEDIKIISMEIITKPTDSIRSDMVLDVQKGIKARYDTKENKLIIYSKKGIDISMEEIQSLIMQEYFAERNEDIVSDDVIAFAGATDTTLDDITNRLKTAYTDSVAMPNKETKFDLSSRTITNLNIVCNQEFAATGIRTFVVTSEQAKKFAAEIKILQEQNFKFIIACKSDSIIDITDYDGLIINAVAITNIDQAMKFMESLKKKVLKQGLAKQISVKFSDEVYSQFESLSVDVLNNFGIMPIVNAEKMWNVGKCEVENITENNIEQLLRSNNVIGLVIDNARVFVGKKSIIKQLFSKEHKYNKGYNASLSSKFDYVCYDITKLKDILAMDINNDEQLQILKTTDLSGLNLSADSLTYLEYLKSKERYEEMAGFIRGIAMNSARTQIINGLKEKDIELDMDKFVKEANGKYQKAFLTVAVQLMMEGIDITTLLETGYIDSNMTTKQYLDSIYEKVYVNIEDILKQNEYKIERTQDTAKTIEDFKNYAVLLDNLRIIKETTANFDMSMKAVRGMLAAA